MRRRLPRLLAAIAVVALIVASVATLSDGADADAGAAFVDPEGEAAQTRGKPHVVLLILDEFPGDALLAPNRRIDAVRYPNFAALARNSTWFPNAWSAYDSTPKAVPLIMDGRKPYIHQPADRRGHRRTLFDTLGRRGYRMNVSEEATAICPRRYCKNARRRRPAIIPNLNHGRIGRFDRWAGRIRPGRPTFHLKHALLPHGPYLYLPSGAQTRTGPRDPVPGMNSPPGYHDRFLTQHNHQRYLLQQGFIDRKIGALLRKMVREGTFDNSLIVVVADHGFVWRAGVPDRRKVRNYNVEEVTPVPLFIKAPGQRQGRINRSLVSTLDIAPTVADVLNIRMGYRTSGRSAFSRRVRRRSVVRLPTRDFSRIVKISRRRWEAKRRRVIRRRLRQFGYATFGLFDRIGPNRGLVGRQTAALRRGRAGRIRARFVAGGRLRRVRRSTGLLPTQIAGRIRGGSRRAKRNLAVSLNGRIEAVGRSFHVRGRRGEYFAVNVPEGALREGRNGVVVYEVGRSGLLRPLGSI